MFQCSFLLRSWLFLWCWLFSNYQEPIRYECGTSIWDFIGCCVSCLSAAHPGCCISLASFIHCLEMMESISQVVETMGMLSCRVQRASASEMLASANTKEFFWSKTVFNCFSFLGLSRTSARVLTSIGCHKTLKFGLLDEARNTWIPERIFDGTGVSELIFCSNSPLSVLPASNKYAFQFLSRYLFCVQQWMIHLKSTHGMPAAKTRNTFSSLAESIWYQENLIWRFFVSMLFLT